MKIDIIYATITGNNELLAKAIAQEFKKHDQKAVIHEFEDTDVDDFNDSDIVVIVCYTYDNGSIPDESLDFYDDLEDTDWSGKICGVAGSGDEFYGRDFCVAVDSYSEQVKKTGANMPADAVKIQLAVDDSDAPVIKDFVDKLLAADH